MANNVPDMFNLFHCDESVGRSALESGDPDLRSASGVFINVGNAKALAGWIKSIGGSEDNGAVHITLDDDFELRDSEGKRIQYTDATLISVPEEDEAFLEVTGLAEQDYQDHFSGHIAAAIDSSS